MVVYLNGEIINEKDATISVFDGGFTHGNGLFETMRAYDGTIFALDRHLDRLYKSAGILGYPNIPGKTVLMDACKNTITANNLGDARLRLTVTAGAPDTQKPTILITATPYAGYNEGFYQNGISAIILNGYRTSGDLTTTIKSTSYLSSIMAKRRAESAGYNEAVLVNEKGHIAEGSCTNIFAVKDGYIITPPIEDGLLPGITRDVVIEIAVAHGYHTLQQSLQITNIFDKDELFLTNSLMEIMPLTKLDGNQIGDGLPGKVTQNLHALYRQVVLKAVSEKS